MGNVWEFFFFQIGLPATCKKDREPPLTENQCELTPSFFLTSKKPSMQSSPSPSFFSLFPTFFSLSFHFSFHFSLFFSLFFSFLHSENPTNYCPPSITLLLLLKRLICTLMEVLHFCELCSLCMHIWKGWKIIWQDA